MSSKNCGDAVCKLTSIPDKICLYCVAIYVKW